MRTTRLLKKTALFFLKIRLLYLQSLVLLLATLIISSVTLSAQEQLEFQQFTQGDGLASDFISQLYQDREGYIWIGTENGLNRFDGKHFLTFQSDPKDVATLNDNWVTRIFEDSRSNLWVTTIEGLNLLDRTNGKFQRISLPMGYQGPPFQSNFVIHEDHLGTLWVLATFIKEGNSTVTQELFKLSPPSEKQKKWELQHFLSPKKWIEQRGLPPFSFLLYSTHEYLWYRSRNVNYRVQLTPQQSRKVRYQRLGDLLLPNTQGTHRLQSVTRRGETLYIASLQGLYATEMHSSEPKLELIQEAKGVLDRREDLEKRDLRVRPSLFYTGTEWEVLYYTQTKIGRLDSKTGQLRWISRSGDGAQTLFYDHIGCLLRDRQGNYWIGTEGSGLQLAQQSKKPYQLLSHDPNTKHSLPKGQIRSLIEDETGKLWVSILNHGLTELRWDQNNNLSIQRDFAPAEGFPNDFAGNRIIKIMKEDGGDLWAATLYQGLVRFDPQKELFTTYSKNASDENTVSQNRLWGLEIDRDGIIWIGTWEEGLNRLDPSTGLVERFYHEPQVPNSLGSENIRCMYIDRQNVLWIGTDNGLGRYDIDQKTFSHFYHDPADTNSISDELVWAIHEDQKGILWVGTNFGLNRFDPTTKHFERFSNKDGLPDNTIYGILEDDDGTLWVSTENGLAREIKEAATSLRFISFGAADGLPSTSFLPKAFLNSSSSDQLLFGTTEGILVVKPSLLQKDTVPVLWGLHEIKRFQRSASADAILTEYFIDPYSRKLSLSYMDQSISITLADLNQRDHPGYKYEYRLQGFNKQWLPLEEDMQLSFSNLSAGSYTLLTRAKTLGDLVVNETELLFLKVSPPWWKTWWAYTLYVLSILGSTWLLYQSRLKRQFQLQEAENIKALDSFKNEFFTNITHEFRTPLTIILGMSEQLKKEPKRWWESGLDLISKNGTSLLNLINQILELQKVESGYLKADLQQGDIIPFLSNIFEQFKAYAHSKEQQMIFLKERESIQMDYDPEKTLRILSNLLSNAIKFAPEKGEVRLEVSVSTIPKSPKQLILQVHDNGPGIPQEQLPNIFDRFYQASSAQKTSAAGTGVGLALTLELVKLLGGEIEVSSTEGIGTTFEVLLPITRKAPIGKTVEKTALGGSIFGSQPATVISSSTINEELPIALIVEDNPDIAHYLQICLEHHYQTVVAVDGQAGIEQAIELIPDVIVSDVMMPKKDGIELCAALKEDIRTSHIPIILLTAKSDIASRLQGLKQGADDYLAKPFHEEELLIRMQNLLEIRRKLHERYQNLSEELNIMQNDVAPSQEDEFILKLREITEAQIENADFGSEELGKALFLSRSQLGRKVKALTGRTPALYIRSIRLHKAKELLLTTTLPIKTIGYEVGFSSRVHFSRSYTDEFGESPTNTREKA